MTQIYTILFDLDGTLVDTAPDLMAAHNHVMQKYGKNEKKLSDLSLEEIKKVYKDLDKKVLKVFDVKNSMNAKKSYGGTSEINVKSMIKKYKKELK